MSFTSAVCHDPSLRSHHILLPPLSLLTGAIAHTPCTSYAPVSKRVFWQLNRQSSKSIFVYSCWWHYAAVTRPHVSQRLSLSCMHKDAKLCCVCQTRKRPTPQSTFSSKPISEGNNNHWLALRIFSYLNFIIARGMLNQEPVLIISTHEAGPFLCYLVWIAWPSSAEYWGGPMN